MLSTKLPLPLPIMSTQMRCGAILLLSLIFVACSGASPRAKRRLGMKSHHVSLSALGSEYKRYRRSVLDPFDASPKVKRLRKTKTVIIKYHSYKLGALDLLFKRGSELYGTYRFATSSVDRFELDLANAFGKQWRSMRAAEMGTMLAVLKEREPRKYKALRASHGAVKISIRADQSLVKKSRATYTELTDSHTRSIRSLKRSPERSLLVGDVMKDFKRLQDRLKKIESGGPKLAKRLGALKLVVTALSVVF